jgi:hypothetical protein
MILPVVFDAIFDMTGGFRPYFEAQDVDRELQKALDNLKPRNNEVSRKISATAIKAIVDRFIKLAALSVDSGELSALAEAEFQSIASEYMSDLLSGDLNRINRALAALRGHMKILLCIYNNAAMDQDVQSFYSITVDDDSLNMTTTILVFLAYLYFKRNDKEFEALNTITMAQKIDHVFDYSNVDNEEWDQEVVKYKKQFQDNTPNYK